MKIYSLMSLDHEVNMYISEKHDSLRLVTNPFNSNFYKSYQIADIAKSRIENKSSFVLKIVEWDLILNT